MFVFRLFSLCMLGITALTSSISSESQTLLTCSKFHFEEKVLEKLVRLEHKMQLFEEKMKMMESAMSKKLERMDEIEKENNEAEKERERKIKSMQRDSREAQQRFNISYEEIVKKFKVQSNNTLQELILQQKKEFKDIMEKKDTVAFSVYRSSSQMMINDENVIFNGVWTNEGNGYDQSTGIFKAPHPGLYHLTAVVMSTTGNGLDFYLHNSENRSQLTRRALYTEGYKTGTIDVIFNLQKGNNVQIKSGAHQTIFSNSDKYITFSGYRIT